MVWGVIAVGGGGGSNQCLLCNILSCRMNDEERAVLQLLLLLCTTPMAVHRGRCGGSNSSGMKSVVDWNKDVAACAVADSAADLES